jgi:predicted NUDIX family NTP pyrophosphohydrolase
MAVMSAGIVMYHNSGDRLDVLLVHPGGFFWRNRDLGAWSIPKGEFDASEDAEIAARREFKEELGVEAIGALVPLGDIRQRSGKVVHAFALEGDLDVNTVRSNMVAVEWPRRSGRMVQIPEIDRAAWFDLPLARKKILASQIPLLDRLELLVQSARGVLFND